MAFGREVSKITERPLTVTFIDAKYGHYITEEDETKRLEKKKKKGAIKAREASEQDGADGILGQMGLGMLTGIGSSMGNLFSGSDGTEEQKNGDGDDPSARASVLSIRDSQ